MSSANNVTIRKFPITAPDGTEYCVKISELNGVVMDFASATLYIPRKRFGFRTLFRTRYYEGEGVYDASNPDFIAIATDVIREYYAHSEISAQRTRKHAESILRKQSALDRFAEWDGKITEVSE